MRGNRRVLGLTAIAATLIIATGACGGSHSPLIPKSGGNPYEVLIVSNDTAAKGIVREAMDADAEGLPQEESSFDISTTDSAHFNQAARLARNIVVVNINASLYTSTRIRYEKDVYAAPQMIAYVNTPSVQSLRHDITFIAPKLRELMDRAEINAEIENLDDRHNIAAEKAAEDMFGYSILIPTDMKSSKRGRNFLWFSDNGANSMSNICIYSLPLTQITIDGLIRKRDSLMRINIPGERPTMFMHTVAESVTARKRNERGTDMLECRGLWEMENDAMGGPFVLHAVNDSAHRRTIIAEAFIYAPGTKKRNKLKKAEAALYTLHLQNTKKEK